MKKKIIVFSVEGGYRGNASLYPWNFTIMLILTLISSIIASLKKSIWKINKELCYPQINVF